MRTYTTKQSDIWSGIAHRELGDVLHTDKLLNANRKHMDSYVFPAGVELVLPEITPEESSQLPPWRQGMG